jgi:hypothetical protein
VARPEDGFKRAKMFYAIRYLCHRTDITMGHHGFTIDLHPKTPEIIKSSGITQEYINTFLNNMGRGWLDAVGYDAIYDPDNYGYNADKKAPPGPNAHPLYGVDSLQVQWGEWGPEHISVPGNACGLDLDRSCGNVFPGGKSLVPHNVDSWRQKYLFLIMFTEIAELVLYGVS